MRAFEHIDEFIRRGSGVMESDQVLTRDLA